MPELPDVEIFRKEADKALHAKITQIDILDSHFVGITKHTFNKDIVGKKIQSTLCRGKYLFLYTENKTLVVLHFGMTGYLKYLPARPGEYHCFSAHRLPYRLSRRLFGQLPDQKRKE